MKRSKRWPWARRARVGVAAAVAAIGAMAFGGGSAQAANQPFSATFDDGALNVGAVFDIVEPPDVATMTGTWNDNGSNAINVLANDFVFPPSTGEVTSGVTATVNFGAVDPITGTFDPATGTLSTTSSTYEASVSLNGTAPCVYDSDLSFTTDDTPGAPWPGDPFDPFPSNSTNVTATHGDIQTSWPASHWLKVSPTPDNCSIIDSLINGVPGGVAFANGLPDLTPPPPPETPTAIPPAPKKKKCKKAKKGSAQSAKKKKCKKKKK